MKVLILVINSLKGVKEGGIGRRHISKGAPIQPLQVMLDPVSQPLQVMLGAVSQPPHAGGSLSASMVHAEDDLSATVSHVDTVEKNTR